MNKNTSQETLTLRVAPLRAYISRLSTFAAVGMDGQGKHSERASTHLAAVEALLGMVADDEVLQAERMVATARYKGQSSAVLREFRQELDDNEQWEGS